MGVKTEWVRYGNEAGRSGYLAIPDRDNAALPVVMVIQEIWGVDEHIQSVVNRFAAAGYAAFAPELYFANGAYIGGLDPQSVKLVRRFMDGLPPGAWTDPTKREEALNACPETERNAIRAAQQAMFSPDNQASYLTGVEDAIGYLKEREETKNGKIGTVGFCMGGALSAKAACMIEAVAGAVIFYGTAPQKELLASAHCPIIGFYGELDARITDQVPAFAETMKELGKSYEYRIYPGAPHAFFNDERPSYRAAAARDAFRRTLNFLQTHIG